MVLQEPKKPVEHVYFVESGLVSLRVVAAGSMLETAVIGYRGVVGTSFFRSPEAFRADSIGRQSSAKSLPPHDEPALHGYVPEHEPC